VVSAKLTGAEQELDRGPERFGKKDALGSLSALLGRNFASP
jgi:hypothetical protein